MSWNNAATGEIVWVSLGIAGQALFSFRFVIQWLASERANRSTVPVAFWYFSLAGGATLLAYAIFRTDPVFIVGQAGGLLIYVRNLHLIYRRRDEQARRARAGSSERELPANHRGVTQCFRDPD